MLVVKSKESERHTQPAHTQACIHPPPGETTTHTHTRAARTAMAVHPGMAEGKRKEESVSCIHSTPVQCVYLSPLHFRRS